MLLRRDVITLRHEAPERVPGSRLQSRIGHWRGEQSFQVGTPLDEVAAHIPEPAQRGGRTQRERVACRCVRQSATQVRVLGFGAIQGDAFVGGAERRIQLLGQRLRPFPVPRADSGSASRRIEQLSGCLPDGFSPACPASR